MKTTAAVLSLLVFPFALSIADDVEAQIATGKAKYALCGACHGMDGSGQPAPGMQMAPAYTDSKLVKADPEVMAYILFKGIKKEDPAAYMGQMMLALGATLPDEDVAALIAFVRSEYGDVKEEVPSEKVAEWREKYKDAAQPTRAELEKLAAELEK